MKSFIIGLLAKFTGVKLKTTLVLIACLVCLRANVSAGVPGMGSIVYDPTVHSYLMTAMGKEFQQLMQDYQEQVKQLQEAVKSNDIAKVTQVITKDSMARMIELTEQQVQLLQTYLNNPQSAAVEGSSPFVLKFNQLYNAIDKSTQLNFIGTIMNPTLSPLQTGEAIRGIFMYIIGTKIKAFEIKQKFESIVKANGSSGGGASLSGGVIPSVSGILGSGGSRGTLMLNDGQRIELIERYTNELTVLHGALKLYQARAVNQIKAMISRQVDGKMQYFGSGVN